MLECPSCCESISGRAFARHAGFKPYRFCPHCGCRITVDARTKRRQVLAIVIALVCLVMSIGLTFFGRRWLLATLVGCGVLVGYIWWGNRRVRLVVFEDSRGDV